MTELAKWLKEQQKVVEEECLVVDRVLEDPRFAGLNEWARAVVYDVCAVGIAMPTRRYKFLSESEKRAVDEAIVAVQHEQEASR
jgi:hypothetical protein